MKTKLLVLILLNFSYFVHAQIPQEHMSQYRFSNNLKNDLDNVEFTGSAGSLAAIQYINDRNAIANQALEVNGASLNGYRFNKIFNDLSVSMWLKTSSSNEYIIASTASGSNNGFSVFSNGANELGIYLKVNGSQRQWIENLPTFFDNNWHHLVITIRTQNTGSVVEPEVYIDGVLNSNFTNNLTFNVNSTNLTIFGLNSQEQLVISPVGSREYTGSIDDILIYDYVLTQSNVTSLFNRRTQPSTVFVNANATGANDGTSWTDAYTNLGVALYNSFAEDELWIARGRYVPTDPENPSGAPSRGHTITIDQVDMKLYGGFNGTETSVSQRDMTLLHTTNSTIISGDMNNDDSNVVDFNETTWENNAYHVMTVDRSGSGLEIDGVTIQNGYCDGSSGSTRYGAGILVKDNIIDFSIKNSVIKNNVAFYGAGILFQPAVNASVTIDACVFDNNLDSHTAAAFYFNPINTTLLDVSITNSLFSNNISKDDISRSRYAIGAPAGWIRATSVSNALLEVSFVNNTLVNNFSDGSSGGTDNAILGITGATINSSFTNNIFWGNRESTTLATSLGRILDPNLFNVNDISNCIAEDNFNGYPTLATVSNVNPNLTTDFKLQTTSTSAIDNGLNSALPSGVTMDLAGNNRIENITVDIGAYEYVAPCIINIPDAALKADIISNGSIGGIDTNNDGEIQCSEAISYTGTLTLTGITNLGNWSDPTGLEAFTEITGLVFSTATTNVSSIDLTANTKIETLNINGEGFTSMNISTLNLLTDLQVVASQLTTLDISNNIALRTFIFDNGQLSSLDFSNLIDLESIRIRNNSNLSTFTVSNNPLLTQIDAANSELTTINVSSATNLIELSLFNNQLSSIDVTSNTNLEVLIIDGNSISSLDLTQNTVLTTLFVGQNNLTALDVTQNVSLSDLTIEQNNFATLDLSQNSNLESITVSDNTNIANLDLSANAFLLTAEIMRNSNLVSLNLANGNNGVSTTNSLYYVDTTANINLSCIQHDVGFDPTNTNGNWTKDASVSWSANCGSIQRTLTTNATNGSVSTNPNPTNGTYDDGTSVTLTATPDAGYQFDGWSGDATGTTNPLTITMDADKIVTAIFSAIQRTLTINATNGAVSTNPNPTNGTYDDGTSVVLTATPDAGYQFDGWSGDATGTTNPLTITMDVDKTVTAIFSAIQRTLTINANNGSVSINPNPTNGTYDDGTSVTLTATPDAGYQFDGWSGDATGTTNPLTITMDADKTVTAMFSAIQRTLTINATNGAVSTNPNPTNGTYDDGTSVTLTATPDAGYQFDGWSGDATGTTNPLTIMMDADKTVTAMFSAIQRTLTINATNGAVSTNPNPTNGTYDDGISVVLTATPDVGYQFDGWSGDASGTTNPLTITMDADKTVTALFSVTQRTLTINAANGSVSTNPNPTNGTYNNGTSVTLTATPDAGYQFDGWSGDATGTTNPLTITMDADKTVIATFSQIQYTVVVSVTGNGNVSLSPSTSTYTYGQVVTATATADVNWDFDTWGGDLSGSANPIQITIDGNKNISATFNDTTLGVNDQEFPVVFTVYPNPVVDNVYIKTDEVVTSVKLYSLVGNEIRMDRDNSSQVDVSYLSKGVYFLIIETDKGRGVQRFIKH